MRIIIILLPFHILFTKSPTPFSSFQVRYDDDDDDDGPIPDAALEGGMPLPIRMAAEFPPELVATPIEDIDTFYADKKVYSLYRVSLNVPEKKLSGCNLFFLLDKAFFRCFSLKFSASQNLILL